LGRVSKRGNRYLRQLFVRAARVVLLRPQNSERYGLKRWIDAAAERMHYNKLAIALANKLARIAWGVLHSGGKFETRTQDHHAPEPA
jgi:transposase